MDDYDFELFAMRVQNVFVSHDIEVEDGEFEFSATAIESGKKGNWSACAVELRDKLAKSLQSKLTPWHNFVDAPYVRSLTLPDGTPLNLAVINEQSREWYGSETFLVSCDFLKEKEMGCFDGCTSFVDIGGHQIIWAIYYAKTSPQANVISFEPSVLNCAIGLFNCLTNGVMKQVRVVPFAVACETTSINGKEDSKMLVDFMTIPLKLCHLKDYITAPADFVKTDIEGYEYEMLSDPTFVSLLKSAKSSHLEMHCGHLIKRGITTEDCANAMRNAGLNGIEYYSGREMYDFMKDCDPNGFHAFITK